MTLVLEQLLNGLQFGVMLFLLAAGLTLIFGIMGVINLAHGSLYMVGAYAAAFAAAQTGSVVIAIVIAWGSWGLLTESTQMALDAIQLLGGNGYINDYPTGRLLRDANLYEIGAGTSEIRRYLIGRELFAETA